ncbi:MAG: hypothetical protein AB1776_08435 [Bacillota bacterium]
MRKIVLMLLAALLAVLVAVPAAWAACWSSGGSFPAPAGYPTGYRASVPVVLEGVGVAYVPLMSYDGEDVLVVNPDINPERYGERAVVARLVQIATKHPAGDGYLYLVPTRLLAFSPCRILRVDGVGPTLLPSDDVNHPRPVCHAGGTYAAMSYLAKRDGGRQPCTVLLVAPDLFTAPYTPREMTMETAAAVCQLAEMGVGVADTLGLGVYYLPEQK